MTDILKFAHTRPVRTTLVVLVTVFGLALFIAIRSR